MSDVNVRLMLSDGRLVLIDRLVFKIRPNTRYGRSLIMGELKPNEKVFSVHSRSIFHCQLGGY
jgi:hypothetical protein